LIPCQGSLNPDRLLFHSPPPDIYVLYCKKLHLKSFRVGLKKLDFSKQTEYPNVKRGNESTGNE
jgi:hypothetical protein